MTAPDPNDPTTWDTPIGTGVDAPDTGGGAFGGANGAPVPPDPAASGGGPYGQATATDNLPLDNLGSTADLSADATDNSVNVNVTGANDVAANAAAEAQEIAAVPDPQSPAGQAAILAIIEKYHGKSTGTVESSAATEQANGSQAADDSDHDHDHDSKNSSADQMGGSSTSLMDILSSLLSSGGSGMSGMNPMGQGMSPFGQQQGMGASPFGDPYAQQAGATPAANPAADPFAAAAGAPATQAASYTAADPFTSTPSGGTGTVTTADNTTSADPFAASTDQADSDKDKTGDAGTTDDSADSNGGSGAAASAGSSGSGVDVDAFGGADGAAVPADPAAATG